MEASSLQRELSMSMVPPLTAMTVYPGTVSYTHLDVYKRQGVLLTLMAVPEKAILCFIVYQMVQFMA